MIVAEAIGRALVDEGITLAAGIAGQAIAPVINVLGASADVSLMYARQERVAFDICDGFARACGRPAVVFADSGPAAANVMGGLVNSWGDSIPVLFLAGHNDRTQTPARATKELPFLEVFGPVSKWAAVIDDPSKVAEVIRRAFMHLTTGRPGPVCLALPHDVGQTEIGAFSYTPVSNRKRVRGGGDPDAIAEAVNLLAAADRPYLYAGAGVLFSEASEALVRLADLLTVPVATTINGKSAFPEHHPLSLGLGGFGRANYGSLPATVMAEQADVICTVGCGFKQHTMLARPGVRTRHIQIDADASEINRDHVADVAILGDARIVLRQLASSAAAQLSPARLAPVEVRLRQVRDLKTRWAAACEPLLGSNEQPINPFRVTREFARLVDPAQTIVLHDAGSVRGSTAQHYVATTPRSFLGFGAQSAMGWSLGAAMGAKKARPTMLVATFIGEEAFNETAMDVETSVRNDAPILIIVKNNRQAPTAAAQSQLRHVRFHQGVEIGALAEALGAKPFRVTDPQALVETLSTAISAVRGGRTAVVEVVTARVNGSLHRLWDKPSAR